MSRRLAQRLLAVAATAGAIIAAAMPATAATRTPSPSPSAAPPPVALHLNTFDPTFAHQGDTLTLTGDLVNTSDDTLTNVSVALRSSTQRIATRYDLARDSDPATLFGVSYSSTRQRLGESGRVEPNQTVGWQISIPVDKLGLPTSASLFGAYPIAIEATTSSESGTTRTRLPTTLMWVPKGAQFTPTQVSWLWPIVDGVHRGLGNTFLDDGLATELASGGRLSGLVKIASESKLPLTYIVDPALVDDARAMAASVSAGQQGGEPSGSPSASASPKTPTTSPSASKSPPSNATGSPSPAVQPYQVATGNNATQTKPGTGALTAANWLAALQAAVAAPKAELVGLPYGDADLVALDRAGLDKEIAIARSTGQSLLRAELAAPTLPDVVWPVDSALNQSTLDELASDLVTTVVLTDQALPPVDPNAISGPRADLQTASGMVHAVLTDSTLDSLIANPSSVAGGERVAEQRFLAETMLVTEQRPGSGSSLVVAPPRHANPTGFLADLLSDTGAVPWIKPVGLGQIADQPSNDIARQALTYPQSARSSELAPSALAPISNLRDGLAAFSAILGANTNDPFVTNASLAILRAESSAWRAHADRSTKITDSVRTQLNARTNSVFISKPGLITLTSRKQKIPLTVVNELPDPVTLQIRLTAVNAARLKVTPIAPFTVDGKGSRHEVVVEVEATTGGRFDVEAQLLTPDATARPIGGAVSFELNSTAYGAVALAIAGSAAGLLFLLSGIRIYRRVRNRRGGPPDETAQASPEPQPVS